MAAALKISLITKEISGRRFKADILYLNYVIKLNFVTIFNIYKKFPHW